ncbi:hypothetical protein NP493_115g14003 [Ridgeia piscesae]|uniref:Homeobox domain-containing protein n=1 Tax=Ridgeia piscesae TaxID=27915 RepID=A0AAD9UH91_RIDPI|nr:hypothetical protein NP493_115g14003 [Ridgeia piscesae]
MKQDMYQDQQMTGRQKRMRTSFKHHQLRTMKSYFSLNHNPDTKDLKQLAQKTGLNKRVLQVWFQNARAKYRRNLLKGQGKQSGDEGELKTGGSRHEASLSELSSATSPAMSDSSSTPSLPDMTSSSRDESIEQLSNSNLTELFSTSLNAVDDGYC